VRQLPKISIFAPAGKTMRCIEKWLPGNTFQNCHDVL